MIAFTDVLWLLVWGGMFTGLYSFQLAGGLSDPLSFFQAVRALFPIIAVYLCLLWMLAKRPGASFLRMPTGFLLAYCAVGTVSSIFLSPSRGTALYWAAEYAAPLLAVWVAVESRDAMKSVRRVLFLNNVIIIVIAFALLPDLLRVGGSDARFSQFYNLPFNLGEMRANGVGRFALLTIIVAFTYMICRPGKGKKLFWGMILLPALFMLAQTRSRTSLLGLAISATLIILILGIDWRFIFVGPVATYLIYISGIKWRLHGHVEKMMFLTGREYTWQRGLEQIKHSPFLGWGFHADRLMLNSEHMHNSYLHAAIHSGIIGTLMFIGAIIAIWRLILRSGLLSRIRSVQGPDLPLLMQSVLIVGFMTGRSFFESTAAFYGVDLLILVPAMTYIYLWLQKNPAEEKAREIPVFETDVSAGEGLGRAKSIESFK
jgi:O-antigen ligase